MIDDRGAAILRGLATRVEGRRASAADLNLVWQRLGRRELRVSDVFTTGGWSNLVLRIRARAAAPGSDRNLKTFERILLGETRKELSHELGRSASTVAQLLKQELVDIGLDCSPGRVPQILVMLAHAARGFMATDYWSLGRFSHGGVDYLVLGSRLDSPLIRKLPPAVRAVVSLHVAGRSHADIAIERKTSRRTVANQVAAAFQRLGVSGRLDLLHLLAVSPRPGGDALLAMDSAAGSL